MIPQLLAGVDGVVVIVTTAGAVPATATIVGGFAITAAKLYVVLV